MRFPPPDDRRPFLFSDQISKSFDPRDIAGDGMHRKVPTYMGIHQFHGLQKELNSVLRVSKQSLLLFFNLHQFHFFLESAPKQRRD